MALTQGARIKIKSFVQEIKKKLIIEFEAQLQSLYGIRPDGICLMVDDLTSKESSIIQTASLLRGRLEYIKTTIAGKEKDAEAVAQLVREQAFTILNRFAALRMAEERNIIRSSIQKGYNSEGFQVYDQLTGGATSADQFSRYTWYLNAVFDELAVDLPAIFDRYSPYALLFPSEKVVLELLEIINDHQLVNYREEGYQFMNLWKEDETIGWVYQYYNSREEISAMREASGAPRNSRELAVRNQFFTPRYVVQFLVDNSLGQQWYEMTQGNTQLPERCEYMVKRPKVIFLEKGIQVPEEKEADTHYIEYRALKDPRSILMLDPACGSMHFGLYCFDLYEIIYKEAWDNHPNLLQDLRDKWTRAEFIKHIPGLILRHNIHGVDIDPRAIQMAGLSLWLRAQRYYDGLNLEPKDRPSINKSNLVVAEPLPGDIKMLNDFAQSLPGPIAKLLKVIWDKMKLAGETGLLLKIEDELKKEIEIAKEEWKEYKDTSAQGKLFDSPQESKAAEMAAIYGKEQKITKDFFDTAEEEVLKALEAFAENAQGANAFQKLLFAEDTARGFAFIELCRKRYDVIFQNPPFGAASQNSKSYIDTNYPNAKTDLAACFIQRMRGVNTKLGDLGSITTRTLFFIGDGIEKWRNELIFDKSSLYLFTDFGLGVLDAMVETAAYILSNRQNNSSNFLKIANEPRGSILKEQIDKGLWTSKNLKKLSLIPGIPLAYWVEDEILNLFKRKSFNDNNGKVITGLQTSDNPRFTRLWFEVPFFHIVKKNWVFFITSDTSTRYFYENLVVVNYRDDGKEVKGLASQKYGAYTRTIKNEEFYFKKGISWAVRTPRNFRAHIIPTGIIDSVSRPLAFFDNDSDILFFCGLWNTFLLDYIFKLSVKNIDSPKFNSTIIKNSPSFSKDEFRDFEDELVLKQYENIRVLYSYLDTSIYFDNNIIFSQNSIKETFSSLGELVRENRQSFLYKENQLNDTIISNLNIKKSTLQKIKEEVDHDIKDLTEVFSIKEENYFSNIVSILIGSTFGRWDMRLLKFWKNSFRDPNIFKERIHSPFLKDQKASVLDLVLPEYHDEIKTIWELPYPIEVLEECATVSDLTTIVDKLKEVIQYFWPETYDTIIEELQEHFKVNELSEIFDKHSKFFNAHLKDYSRNKRISPIYWHMGVPSGKFNIWIYYPKLNNDSLYKIVNDLVEPKIKDVTQEVEVLEMSNDSKGFNDQKAFLAELEDFKDELLRVAQLPYQPNQDDGVLITAAPLHNLFRHTKWKKATEACWKKLEKGEYDWAHLAYSIWPDRVREKCKKDLSMAIAHGLEDICEIKPKEKKPRKKKGVKVTQQQKLL